MIQTENSPVNTAQSQQSLNFSPQEGSRFSSLIDAIHEGRDDIIKSLLESGANANATNPLGQSPLFLAAYEGHLKIVQLLLQHGADVSLTTRYGHTPAYIAAVSGHYDILDCLLTHDEKMYDINHPYFVQMKTLNQHARTLIQQLQTYSCEEKKQDKIEFLILLLNIMKHSLTTKQTESMLNAIFNLEKRFQDKIFSSESSTKQLFENMLHQIYLNSGIAIENIYANNQVTNYA